MRSCRIPIAASATSWRVRKCVSGSCAFVIWAVATVKRDSGGVRFSVVQPRPTAVGEAVNGFVTGMGAAAQPREDPVAKFIAERLEGTDAK
eukprot:3300385-Alexandrium_andersonii.AAC.1